MAAGGQAYFTSEGGKVSGLRAGREREVISASQLGEGGREAGAFKRQGIRAHQWNAFLLRKTELTAKTA